MALLGLAAFPLACNCGGTVDIHTQMDGGAGLDGSSSVGTGEDASQFLPDGGFIRPDASIDFGDGGCAPSTTSGPQARRCAPTNDSECAGPVDTFLTGAGVPAGRLNGASGNGFDDDCDGLVDEGCACTGLGQTKDCYLVPATQASAATGAPVGWCTTNSKGTVDCAGFESTSWTGTCRGAAPPYGSDACQPGDFDCDGLEMNNKISGCQCGMADVKCPTAEIEMKPYPSTTALPEIDGTQWIVDPAKRPLATGWTWTVVGGDCDNVLPFPTFALYDRANSTLGTRKGTRTAVKFDMTAGKYVPTAGAPIAAIRAPYGDGVAGGKLYPAFGLSGDYIVQGELTLNGKSYTCTQKVGVRASGIRAELCWDTVGGVANGNDVDLHLARLQGTGCASKGWSDTCVVGDTFQDCFWTDESGCRDTSAVPPGWGYPNSPNAACIGWSSKRRTNQFQLCTNPRLDKDNITCSRTEQNPEAVGFCGPENINLDNPNNGDAFAVGVGFFEKFANLNAKPHVNLYCNGRRVLSAGYNPATGDTQFPVLRTGGTGLTLGEQEVTGDFWTVATIKANVTGGQLTSCDVTPVNSRHADPTRDGPAATVGGPNGVCIDSRTNASPAPNQFNATSRRFVDNAAGQGIALGAQPATAAQWCKH